VFGGHPVTGGEAGRNLFFLCHGKPHVYLQSQSGGSVSPWLDFYVAQFGGLTFKQSGDIVSETGGFKPAHSDQRELSIWKMGMKFSRLRILLTLE
jgi:hypothetical protein